MTDMNDMNDFERRLWASLDKHAARAPHGDGLDELIIAEAVHGATPIGTGRRSMRTWGFPLLAAAAVAAVVLSIVGVTTWRPTSAPNPPAHSDSMTTGHTPSTSMPTTPSSPTTKHTETSPSDHLVPAGPTESRNSGSTLPDAEPVHGFTAADLTFISSTEGWALGSANCLPNEGTGRCTAIYRTTDGATWHSVPGAVFNVPGVQNCAAPCVSNIRFANDQVGYAYSPSVLFMTVDGGMHWTKQSGFGADALETLDGNVIRLVDRQGAACPGTGCSLHVETALVGSSTWTRVTLPGGAETAGDAQLARTGSSAYILLTPKLTGGGTQPLSVLFASADDGRSWTRNAGAICPQRGGVVEATALAASPGGVALVCQPQRYDLAPFVAISTDAGSSFRATGGSVARDGLLTGDPGTVLVAAGADASLSTDGGAHWRTIGELSGRPGGVSFIGFESETTGRAITDNGRKIWTTSDGGKSWSQFAFPN